MDEARAGHLHRGAQAGRWDLSPAAFAEGLKGSAAKVFATRVDQDRRVGGAVHRSGDGRRRGGPELPSAR